jgi:hypothetical protein
LADLCARYEIEMNPDSVPGLIQRDRRVARPNHSRLGVEVSDVK